MSIRLKLTIMFLAIASIPLIFVGALTFHNYKESLEKNHIVQLQNITQFKAERIVAFFAGLKNDIETTQGFFNIKKNLPILTRFSDDQNNAEFADAKKMLDGQLQQMQSVLELSDIMLVEPQGRIVYSSNSEHYPKDFLKPLADPEKKAFEEGKNKIFFSDIFFKKDGGDRTIMLVTAPAYDFNNVFIGVIALEVDAKSVYRTIGDVTGLGDTGEVIIGKKTGNQLVYLNPPRHDPNAVLTKRIDIGGAIAWPMQQAVQGKTASGQFLDYRGKRVIAAWRYIPSLDWGMVAKIDADEAFADVTNLRNLIFLILVIIFVLSGITAFSIAQSISEPIKKLSEGAQIVGSGNLDHKLGTNLKDEIGQLSRSFDKMTGDLKQTLASRDELNREITERKHVEQALLESKRDLDRAQAVAHSGSWRLDIRQDKLTWSDEAYNIFGVPKGTPLIYETFLSYIHPDDREYVDTKWKAALAGEKYDIEHRIVVDSQIKWVRERAELEIDKDGTLSGGFGTVTDITQRKKMEEELRKSRDELEIRVEERTADVEKERRRLYDVLETLPAYVCLLTPDYYMPFANRVFREWFGYYPDKKCYEFLFNRKEPCEDCQTYTVLKTNKPQRWEWTGPNGHNYDIYDYPFKDTDGSDLILEMGIDVTEQKQAEKALRSASLYTRGLLEASLDPLVTISQDGKITDVNRATELVTGKSREQLIGDDFSDYFTEPQKARKGYQQVFADGFVTDYPLTIRRLDGRQIDVLYNAAIYKNEAGEIQGVFAAARDITEKKAAEAELEKYRLHLEDLVKQRTSELARSNKDLEQFAYVASHDLQEPLRAVSGFIELLKRRLQETLDAKSTEYMNFTTDGVRRMQALINGLLEYSRVDSLGKEPKKTDSKKALDLAVRNLLTSISESKAKIAADDLPTVYFDDLQLTQLFQNLIGNAIKFRSDVTPEIKVSASRLNGAWRFAVADNGIGFEPQYAERIFLIFQRLHGRDKYPGMGIGLSICKKIVERHNGKIWAESKLGRGSTFYFTVPDVGEA